MFEPEAVIASAKDAFWRHGYRQTGISELERCTGLSRSSLYHTFGTKRALFAAAVDVYVSESIDPLVAPMEHGAPSPDAVAAFFGRVAEIFRTDPDWAGRGCLIMNSIAEMAGSTGDISPVAAAFPKRLERAFNRCLKGPGRSPAAAVRRRSELLATTTVGVWLLARADRHRAARVCESVREEVRTWTVPAAQP
jgi:TetR/AcrR family transcriptional regulator, transcriptional repressor for nem operon